MTALTAVDPGSIENLQPGGSPVGPAAPWGRSRQSMSGPGATQSGSSLSGTIRPGAIQSGTALPGTISGASSSGPASPPSFRANWQAQLDSLGVFADGTGAQFEKQAAAEPDTAPDTKSGRGVGAELGLPKNAPKNVSGQPAAEAHGPGRSGAASRNGAALEVGAELNRAAGTDLSLTTSSLIAEKDADAGGSVPASESGKEDRWAATKTAPPSAASDPSPRTARPAGFNSRGSGLGSIDGPPAGSLAATQPWLAPQAIETSKAEESARLHFPLSGNGLDLDHETSTASSGHRAGHSEQAIPATLHNNLGNIHTGTFNPATSILIPVQGATPFGVQSIADFLHPASGQASQAALSVGDDPRASSTGKAPESAPGNGSDGGFENGVGDRFESDSGMDSERGSGSGQGSPSTAPIALHRSSLGEEPGDSRVRADSMPANRQPAASGSAPAPTRTSTSTPTPTLPGGGLSLAPPTVSSQPPAALRAVQSGSASQGLTAEVLQGDSDQPALRADAVSPVSSLAAAENPALNATVAATSSAASSATPIATSSAASVLNPSERRAPVLPGSERQVVLAHDAGSALPLVPASSVPAAPSLTGAGSVPVLSGHMPDSVSDPFSALDATSVAGSPIGPGSPVWTVAGSRQAEAGFDDPSLGWIGVRAARDAGGVQATLVPGSVTAAQELAGNLGGSLDGLHAYLAAQHTPVESLVMASPGSWASGSGASPTPFHEFGQSMGQGTGSGHNSRGGETGDDAGPGSGSGNRPGNGPSHGSQPGLQPTGSVFHAQPDSQRSAGLDSSRDSGVGSGSARRHASIESLLPAGNEEGLIPSSNGQGAYVSVLA